MQSDAKHTVVMNKDAIYDKDLFKYKPPDVVHT